MSQQAPPARTKAPKVKESKSATVRAAQASPSRRQVSRWERERHQKRLVFYAAGALAAVALLVLGFGLWRELVARPNEPAAVIGDEIIPINALVPRVRPQLQALDNEMARLASGQSSSGAFGPPSGDNNPARQLQTLQSQKFSAPDQILTDMIDEELIRRDVVRRGLSVTPDELDARVQSEVARLNNLITSGSSAPPAAGPGPTPVPTAVPTLTAEAFGPAYDDILQRSGFTDEMYRAFYDAQIRRDKLRDALVADQPRVQEHVHVRRMTVAQQEDATLVLAQIHSGEATLEDLAREKSTDLTSRSAGGELPWLPRGIESTQFDDAAFRLAVGELSEPVVTPQGFEILQVLEKEQRPLSDEHWDRLRTKAMDAWLRQAREEGAVRRELTPERRDWVLRQAGVNPNSLGPGGPEGPARRF